MERTNVADQHYQVLSELADCYAALSEYDQARQRYVQAAELAPDDPRPHVGLGVVSIQAERLDEAEASFRRAISLDPRSAEAYGGLAMVYQQQQELPAAFQMYLKCLELDVENLVALLGLFQISMEMGTFAKIIHFLEVYLDKHPGDVSVLFCLATLYARDGRLIEARDALRNVLALEPGKTEATDLLAQVDSALAARPAAEVA